MSQIELFTWINPLKEKWNTGFLSIESEKPGIYRFYDKSENLLYVGKSKCLKHRVRSYTHIHPAKHSKRLVQLVQKIERIEIEETQTEKHALLLENNWLRTHKPPFNRANTKPEIHVFIGIKVENGKVKLGWTFSEEHHRFDELFGAFNGISTSYAMLQAVRIWSAFSSEIDIKQKTFFTKRAPTESVILFKNATSEEIKKQLTDFLKGERFPMEELISMFEQKTGFEQQILQKAINDLLRFFQYKALTNRAIKETFGIKNSLLTKEGIDDWIVKLNF